MSGPPYPPPGPLGAPGPPPGGYGPPPGYPQQPHNGLLLALAFLAVIAVSVAATVWFTHRGSDRQGGNVTGSASSAGPAAGGEVASANDTGPVGIITEDPTCERYVSLQNEVGAQVGEWNKREASVPASSWTAQQRQVFESAARVYKSEAEQLVALARATPHRVMRELYSQVIAYNRAYADAIAEYTPADDELALVRNGLAAAALNVCISIRNFTATNRGATVAPAAPPSAVGSVTDPATAQRFVKARMGACQKLASVIELTDNELQAWFKSDANIPASQRTAAENVLNDMAAKVLTRYSGDLDRIGRASGDPIFEDFLVLSAQYYRAYVTAIPTYVSVDNSLYQVGQKLGGAVDSACIAA